jgi:small GTP-binding protein
MIVGTAGHIDHGKTSLVKALTGIDADRLKEEKERGITVDLGFAYQPQDDGQVLGFVDVPGHEKLVRNMLAGATGIDHVMLVVAADDGPMPQTREHLAILDLLGLQSGVVALSKCDLVDESRLQQVGQEIRTLLCGTGLEHASVLPVSSISGAGLDALAQQRVGKTTLRTVEIEAKPAPDISAMELKAIREKLKLSRPVFAHYLRTNPRTLENWEQGRAKPNAQAALLIHLVDRYPDTVKRLAAV